MTSDKKCAHVYGVDLYQDENFHLTTNPIYVSRGAEFTFCPYCGVKLEEPEKRKD